MSTSEQQLREHIEQLVGEEHALHDREGLSAEERIRLETVEIQLDQCWDLLRQRRALRDAGRNPEDASSRDEETVEHYLQ